jgi:VIT1/CCC1 family predicted Fe2+/Mn2+ transporter
MAVGNYLGIKSERAVELKEEFDSREESIHAARHAFVTWASFAVAGLVPLVPFFFKIEIAPAFWFSVILACASLFIVGALRTLVTRQSAWLSGVEMLLVGALAGAVAFAAGWGIERLVR